MIDPESRQAEISSPERKNPFGEINGHILAVATLIGLYLCYRLAQPFLPALVWALTLAVIFAPFQRMLERRISHSNTTAAITVLVIAVIVVLPAFFVVNRLLLEIVKGAEFIQKIATTGDLRETFKHQPLLSPFSGWIEQQMDLSETFRHIATWLTNSAAAFVRGSVTQLMGILITFYMLFYFLRDRRKALASLRALSFLPPGQIDRMFTRVVDTIHATVYGTLAMAALQGILGGLMFWILGLPSPLLWGIVMGLLAIIPVLGAFIIWIPAALWLASQGEWGKALILTAWGGIVVAGIDNLIYPVLVGNRLKQHTALAFISLVGGLIIFGSSGLILGPLAVTITLLLLEIRHKPRKINEPQMDTDEH